MTAKKLNLDIFKDSEIEHDKTFIDKDVIVFSLEDPKLHKVVSYSALTHHDEFLIPVADGPDAQSFLDGSCFILENKVDILPRLKSWDSGSCYCEQHIPKVDAPTLQRFLAAFTSLS